MGIKGGKYIYFIYIDFIDEFFDEYGHGDFPFLNDDIDDSMDLDEERYEG